MIVAGGNGLGNNLNQFNEPAYVFVDKNLSVYVTDYNNHRVMKWMKDAKEGTVVAGGQGQGNSLSQLNCPQGVIVDHFDNVYVADTWNNRIMCWSPGSEKGSIVVGGNGEGKNQINSIVPEVYHLIGKAICMSLMITTIESKNLTLYEIKIILMIK